MVFKLTLTDPVKPVPGSQSQLPGVILGLKLSAVSNLINVSMWSWVNSPQSSALGFPSILVIKCFQDFLQHILQTKELCVHLVSWEIFLILILISFQFSHWRSDLSIAVGPVPCWWLLWQLKTFSLVTFTWLVTMATLYTSVTVTTTNTRHCIIL